MKDRGKHSHPLDQLACALTLEKLVRMLELKPPVGQGKGFARRAEHSKEFARGVRFAQEQAKLLSQCFCPGAPEHPFPLAGDKPTLQSLVGMPAERPILSKFVGLPSRSPYRKPRPQKYPDLSGWIVGLKLGTEISFQQVRQEFPLIGKSSVSEILRRGVKAGVLKPKGFGVYLRWVASAEAEQEAVSLLYGKSTNQEHGEQEHGQEQTPS